MTTTHITVSFGIAFVSTVIATPIAKRLGTRLGLVDKPDSYRKIHENAIPLGGGLAVFFGFLVTVIFTLTLFSEAYQFPSNTTELVTVLIASGSIAMLMGLADDLWNLKARWKIVFQLLAATIAYYGGFRVDAISSPFGHSIDLGFTSFLVTLLWFLVCMNAINLADGLDGLSAGIGFIVSLTLLGVNISAGNSVGSFLNASLCGALLGFLIFNFNPASIFLGDSGSMFIGFLIASVSLLTKNKAETATALLIPLMALGLPIYDMAIAIVRRWSRRSPISVADRRHIHHSLLSLGFSHREAVVVLYSISIILCAASVIMVLTRSQYSPLIIALLVLAMIIGTRVLKLINISELRDRLRQDHDEHRWRKSATLAVESSIQRASKAKSLSELGECLKSGFSSLGLSQVQLQITNQADCVLFQTDTPPTSEESSPPETEDQWQVRLVLQNQGKNLGALIVFKRGPIRSFKDSELLIDRMRVAIQDRLSELDLSRSSVTLGKD